jgi:spermidine/putrescine transport system ATP-binding protein
VTGGELRIEHVTKRFGAVTAVDDVDLTIGAGEFFSLLGPSGCGKTTTLRLVAGFEQPSAGRILVGGDDLTPRRPAKRPLNMVFQDYALFPHLTVAENIAFGLRIKHLSRHEQAERITDALRTMRLEGMEERRPAQLSGGQRQRVALARALVNRPRALLLDEPLGALDLQLRKQMQTELRRIHQQTATTFLYVTHDQEEALTMSDRIAVMQDGRVEQLAEPRALYERPTSAFVADFIGTSNLMVMADPQYHDGVFTTRIGEGQRLTATAPSGIGETFDGSPLQITVRPERISLWPEGDLEPDP